MNPVIARLIVLTFLGISAGISFNALLLQEGRVSHYAGKRTTQKIRPPLGKPAPLNVRHVSSVKPKKSFKRTINDVLGYSDTTHDESQFAQNLVNLIQNGLLKLGYHPGTSDGIAGPTTRAAIMAYELDRGLVQTGIADQEILDVIRGHKRHPIRKTDSKLLVKNSQELVSALQKALTKLGYNTGTADGLLGPLTRKRIRGFERDNKMTVTGRVSGKLIDAINKARGQPLILASLS